MEGGMQGWMEGCRKRDVGSSAGMQEWMEGYRDVWWDRRMQGRVEGWKDGGRQGQMEGCRGGMEECRAGMQGWEMPNGERTDR